jgi:hypothetical protein
MAKLPDFKLAASKMGDRVYFKRIFPQWSANLKVTYDSNQWSLQDVENLLLRAGIEVGIGEWRDHGFGRFTVPAVLERELSDGTKK